MPSAPAASCGWSRSRPATAQRERGVALDRLRWYDDPLALAADPEVDVVVELIGGADGPALALCRAALAAGKPVVTANKALLAHHGAELARLAEQAGATIGFEAAVAGGIPIVKTLREGLAGNRVRRVYGILNGTCNYILTTMRETGREFAAVLAGGAAARLRRGRPELRHRWRRRRAQALAARRAGVRLPARFRRGLHRGHPPRLAARHRVRRARWATASSCSASPA